MFGIPEVIEYSIILLFPVYSTQRIIQPCIILYEYPSLVNSDTLFSRLWDMYRKCIYNRL